MEQIEIENLSIDVNKKYRYGRTELHHAAFENDISRVQLLLSKGADVNSRDRDDETPLHCARTIMNEKDEKYYEVAKTLLENGALVDAQDKRGQTTLHSLVHKDNIKMVQLFLNFKAEVNIKNDEDKTPLHEAAVYHEYRDNSKVIDLLLKNGADANAKDKRGCTPFNYLVKKAPQEMVRLFLSSNGDVNVVNNEGCNLLFAAAENNKNVEVLKLLIDLGLDVNHHNDDKKTPLHVATYQNEDDSHYRVIKVLLKNGADIDARNKYNETPFFDLVDKNNLKTVQLFLNYKADINVLDNNKKNLLFQAVKYNKNVKVLQLLIDLGLNVNHRCSLGRTPLHEACRGDVEGIQNVKCLLKNGADMKALCPRGCMPLISAMNNFRMEKETYKKREDFFNFIMEHTDFTVPNDKINILTFQYDDDEGPLTHLWKPILQHIAKLQSLNIPVDPVLMNTISDNSLYSHCYPRYEKELLCTKNTKLKNTWITFHNLLFDSRKKLKNYAGNKDLIKNFNKSNCTEKFLYYGPLMVKNVKKGIKRRVLFDESSIVLSDYLPIFNPNHLIIRDILDCIMSKKDLSKLSMLMK